MISKKQIIEIREHLEKAQSPIFYFDNDADGLCSYLLLRRFAGKGKGIAVRSHPDVDSGYARKAQELNADYVFVLDRPILGKKFVEEINKLGLPIVWIDHHNEDEDEYEGIFRYNPNYSKKKSDEPVSYWCFKISNKIEDIWIAMMGCIADHHLPDFIDDFTERFPELWSKKIKKPFDAYYGTDIGFLSRALGFGLKDSITHVVFMQNYLIKCKSPKDFHVDLESGKPFARKYRDLRKKYDALVDKAKNCVGEKLLFFNYGGDMSISSEISNELCYLYPKHKIIVAYSSGPITNVSIRGKNVKKIMQKSMKDFKNMTGGGHDDAVGMRMQTSDLEKFKNEFEKKL